MIYQKKLASDPTDYTHALTLSDPDWASQMAILPLALQGMTLLLNVRLPTLDEYNSELFTRLHLTSETLSWDPSSTIYEEQDNGMTDYPGNFVSNAAVMGHFDSLVITTV
jgi:hypothetical protein